LDRLEKILSKKVDRIKKELDYEVSKLNRREKQLLAKEISHKLRINKKEAYVLLEDL